MGFFILDKTSWPSLCCTPSGANCEPLTTGNVSSPLFCSRAYVHIRWGMPERHCCLLLKGLPRSMNVIFPSPLQSVTHRPLIAADGVFMERMARMWSQLLGFVWRDKGISGHVNNVEGGYKRRSYELGSITKYHGWRAESLSVYSGKSAWREAARGESSWPDCFVCCTLWLTGKHSWNITKPNLSNRRIPEPNVTKTHTHFGNGSGVKLDSFRQVMIRPFMYHRSSCLYRSLSLH